jgi:glycosyltransferase involved in cell wall biosynthesis
MNSLSVVVTACDNEHLIGAALASVEASIDALRQSGGPHAALPCEIVVVDDGSRDATLKVVRKAAADRDEYTVLHHHVPRSPSAARNHGAAAARGDVLFFLDGDDAFKERHLLECCRALEKPGVGFVKTQVETSHPVLPDWRDRIRNSLAINTGVRRACHDFIGGFPDYVVASRGKSGFVPEFDLFFKVEDVFYNQLLARFFRGLAVPAATVVYHRRPGNSFDRQYAKFQLPVGAWRDEPDPAFDLRVKLCQLWIEHRVRVLEASEIPPEFRR